MVPVLRLFFGVSVSEMIYTIICTKGNGKRVCFIRMIDLENATSTRCI